MGINPLGDLFWPEALAGSTGRPALIITHDTLWSRDAIIATGPFDFSISTELFCCAAEAVFATAHVKRARCSVGVLSAPAPWVTFGFLVTRGDAVLGAAVYECGNIGQTPSCREQRVECS
jgi:hypothetical protein